MPTSIPANSCPDLISISREGMMRTKLQMWTLIVGVAAALALPTLSRAQLTTEEIKSRLGMESHIGNITGHANSGRVKYDYRRYCVGCHGDLGDGNGENAVWFDTPMYQKPRLPIGCLQVPLHSHRNLAHRPGSV